MTDKLKKQLILNLPYLVFVYLFDKLCQGVRLAPGADASEKLLHIGQGFSAAFASLAPSFHLLNLCVGAAGAVLIRLAVYSKGKNAKKYRRGIEYGSARWGTPADIAPYVDKDFSQNVLLTQTERITMSSRPKEPKYARNKNILVIGGSGSGKTRFFVKPNLLQCHSSYVVTDPKGTILQEVGALLERRQYRIKSLNLINFKKSMKYNPLAYIRSEKDILKLVNALILNTKGEGEKSSEDFWVKAERLYYSALIGYIWYEAEPEERNFITLLDLINASEAREDDEEFQSPVDLLFAKLEKEQPDHFAVKQYRKFKMAAGDGDAGRAAEAARNEKIDFLGLDEEKISYDDLALLAKVIHTEAGSAWLSMEWKMAVGEVLLNRVASPEFPDTLAECAFQPGQYTAADEGWFEVLLPFRDCVEAAFRLLSGERVMNDPSVVFQSGGKQGSGVALELKDDIYGSVYFCYSSHPELYG